MNDISRANTMCDIWKRSNNILETSEIISLVYMNIYNYIFYYRLCIDCIELFKLLLFDHITCGA